MHTVTLTRTTTETVEVPDLHDMVIGLGDSGPGGDPSFRGFVTVNGTQLCYADELSPAALAAFNTLRAEAYAKHLAAIGLVTP